MQLSWCCWQSSPPTVSSNTVRPTLLHSLSRLGRSFELEGEDDDWHQQVPHTEQSRPQTRYRLPLISLMLSLSLTTAPLPSHAVSVFPFLDDRPAVTGFAASLQPTEAQKQLFNVQNLQDDRLAKCADNGRNWEQCFFYGTNPITITTQPSSSVKSGMQSSLPSLPSSSMQGKSQQTKTTKSGIPTW